MRTIILIYVLFARGRPATFSASCWYSTCVPLDGQVNSYPPVKLIRININSNDPNIFQHGWRLEVADPIVESHSRENDQVGFGEKHWLSGGCTQNSQEFLEGFGNGSSIPNGSYYRDGVVFYKLGQCCFPLRVENTAARNQERAL